MGEQDFNSHAHVERDDNNETKITKINNFNSHAHVERDTMLPLKGNKEMNFNSHAHVERDYQHLTLLSQFDISTHTLTWSVTPKKPLSSDGRIISTHTLTWSVTRQGNGPCRASQYFNSHAHVERDTPNADQSKHSVFISTHTLTWSVTIIGANPEEIFAISTHTLTWSVTIRLPLMSGRTRFQLTRSRGA